MPAVGTRCAPGTGSSPRCRPRLPKRFPAVGGPTEAVHVGTRDQAHGWDLLYTVVGTVLVLAAGLAVLYASQDAYGSLDDYLKTFTGGRPPPPPSPSRNNSYRARPQDSDLFDAMPLQRRARLRSAAASALSGRAGAAGCWASDPSSPGSGSGHRQARVSRLSPGWPTAAAIARRQELERCSRHAAGHHLAGMLLVTRPKGLTCWRLLPVVRRRRATWGATNG